VTGWLDRPLLDLDAVDLDGAESVTFLLHQVFRYAYDGPAYDVRQRLVALPRARHGNLHRRARHVAVDAGAEPATRLDADGNEVVSVLLPVVPAAVEFTLAALVERVGPATDAVLPAAALADPRLRRPTRLTTPSPELRELAGALRAAHRSDAELAEALCGRLRAEIAFAFDATSVSTTAAEAYALRRGVCQDFAHVMLTVCRLVGIPARYVSGHLLGERGGSHAWVEVLVPDPAGARALALDPTNGCRAGSRHLPVAVGRDYADVAPTSGVYSGPARGALSWTKRAGVTAVGPAGRVLVAG
jgi:transglutaminase-like putative cysteine protease